MTGVRRNARRGAVLVPVLVCFVLIIMVSATILRIGHAQREQLTAQSSALQAEWLVESGFEHAADRLAADPDYQGETWSLSADDLNGPHPGSIQITVDIDPFRAGTRLVTVVASYPSDRDRRSRQRRTVSVDVHAEKTGETP